MTNANTCVFGGSLLVVVGSAVAAGGSSIAIGPPNEGFTSLTGLGRVFLPTGVDVLQTVVHSESQGRWFVGGKRPTGGANIAFSTSLSTAQAPVWTFLQSRMDSVHSIAFAPPLNLWVACGRPACRKPPDRARPSCTTMGLCWTTPLPLGFFGTESTCYSVRFRFGRFWALYGITPPPFTPTAAPFMVTSLDGITWTPSEDPLVGKLLYGGSDYLEATTSHLGQIVLFGTSNPGTASSVSEVITSTDGVTFSLQHSGFFNTSFGVAVANSPSVRLPTLLNASLSVRGTSEVALGSQLVNDGHALSVAGDLKMNGAMVHGAGASLAVAGNFIVQNSLTFHSDANAIVTNSVLAIVPLAAPLFLHLNQNITVNTTIPIVLFSAGVSGTFRAVIITGAPQPCPLTATQLVTATSLSVVVTPTSDCSAGSLSPGAIAGIVVGECFIFGSFPPLHLVFFTHLFILALSPLFFPVFLTHLIAFAVLDRIYIHLSIYLSIYLFSLLLSSLSLSPFFCFPLGSPALAQRVTGAVVVGAAVAVGVVAAHKAIAAHRTAAIVAHHKDTMMADIKAHYQRL
jgi:hypothetical protein